MRAVLSLVLPGLAAAVQCGWTPIGCYNDATARVVDVAMPLTPENVDVDICVAACTLSGFPLAGLTGHTTPTNQAFCYCGLSTAPGSQPVAPSQCNVPCPGNSSQTCGANYIMSLYNTTCDGPLPPAPVGPALANGTACSQPEVQGLPFCNTSLSYAERASDLVGRIALSEAGPLLTARNSPAVPRLGLPAFYWGTNAIHGITNAVSGGVLCLKSTGRCVTIWPSGPSLGATFNASTYTLLGATTGIEMRAMGNVQWGPTARPGVGMDGLTAWGPTINLVRDPRWGRIQETASEDPYLNGVFASGITAGMQYGVDPARLLAVATLKHFAVYSLEDYITADGRHLTRENIDNEVSSFDLSDSYFPHFKAAVTPVAQGGAGAAGVMQAMNSVNGVPCLANPWLIHTLDSWGGKNWGYVTTDGINMIDSMIAPEPDGHGYCPYLPGQTCSRDLGVKAAVEAGSDIADGNEYDQSLLETVLRGNLTVGDVQQRLFNTMLIRFRLGLFDPTEGQPYLAYTDTDVGNDAHRGYALDAARDSMTLLANPGAVLPFARGAGGTTLVIGYAGNATGPLVSNYVGQFCPSGKDECFPGIAPSIAALGETVAFSPGCASATSCPAAMITAAVSAATANGVSRVVLTLGLDQTLEREQKDRENITLPADQDALFGAVMTAVGGKLPVAVVLVHGGAIAIAEVKAAPVAILDAFYPGPAGGQAIAETLFGLNNPGGKLPYTVYDAPYATAVPFENMEIASQGRTYRYNTPSSPAGVPLWPFGFGLSYTTFALAYPGGAAPAALALTPSSPSATVSVTVSNTGAMDGDEVLQAYFVAVAGTLAPPTPPYLPVRQLFAFQRVAVAAGGGAQVTVNVTADALSLTLSDGTRGPIDGQYTLIFSRGLTVGAELTLGCTIMGFTA